MSVRNTFEEHKLFKSLMLKNIELMKQLLVFEKALEKGSDGFIRHECNYYQYYIISSVKAVSNLIDWFEQLEQSIAYIEHQKIDKELEEHKINHVTDLQFKIENHLIRLESLYDRLLMTSNCLLNLGISDNSLCHELVVGNYNVKYYNVDIVLKAVKAVLKPYKEIRNSIIHHRSYNGPGLLDLSALHYLENVEYDLDGLEKIKKEKPSEEIAKLLKELYIEEFKKLNDKLNEKIIEAFNLLNTVFLYEEKVAQVKHQLTTGSTGRS